MHPTGHQRRYPSSLNHTPRNFEIPTHSDLVIASQPVAFKRQQTQLASEFTPSIMKTTVFSAFPATPGPSMTIRRKPIARPRNRASFNIDRPSTMSRRHSWTSPCDLDSPVMLVPKFSDDFAGVEKQKPALTTLPRPGATFEMAYFLKNTGPPPPREFLEKESRMTAKKKSLTIFKKRRETSSTLSGSVVKEVSLENFIPADRVEQKVTMEGKVQPRHEEQCYTDGGFAPGKRYLQIVADPGIYQPADDSVTRR
jgi:hypothetical protein